MKYLARLSQIRSGRVAEEQMCGLEVIGQIYRLPEPVQEQFDENDPGAFPKIRG